MLDLMTKPRLHPQVAARNLEDRAIVVLADAGEVLVLNPSGAQLWQQFDGRRSVGELAVGLARDYACDIVCAERDVLAFIATLLDAKAIVAS
jgi:hypothetical protein